MTTPALYNLLILDYSIPVIDGLKLAILTRSLCEMNNIQVPAIILLTAFEREFFKEDLDETVIYMKKPITREALFTVLGRLNLL